MVAEAVKDARGPAVSYPFAAAADRAAHVEEKVLPAARKFLPRAEMILERSGSGGVLPSGMCYADVLLAELIEVLRGMGVDSCVEGYPLLAALHGRVVALPGVAAYLAGPKRFPFPDGQVADMYKANVAKVLGW